MPLIVLMTLLFSMKIHAENYLPKSLKDFKEYHLEKDLTKKAQLLERFIKEDEDEENFETYLSEIEKFILFSKKGMNLSLLNYGRFLYCFVLIDKPDINFPLEMLKASKIFFFKNKNLRKLGDIERLYGIYYNRLGKDNLARKSFNSSWRYFKSCNMRMEYIHSRALEAKMRVAQKEYSKSAKIIFGCIAKMEKYGKHKTIFGYYNFLSDLYSETGNIKMVKYCNKKSAEHALKSENLNTIALSKNNSAISEFYKGNTEGAITLFREALETRKKMKKYKLISESYYNIASVYTEISKNGLAIEYFNKSLEVAEANNLLAETADAYSALAEQFEKGSNLYMALKMSKLYLATKEKINLISTNEMDALNSKLLLLEKERVGALHDTNKKLLNQRLNLTLNLCYVLVIGYVLIFAGFSIHKYFGSRLSKV